MESTTAGLTLIVIGTYLVPVRRRLILSPAEALLLVDGCIEGTLQTEDNQEMVRRQVVSVGHYSKHG